MRYAFAEILTVSFHVASTECRGNRFTYMEEIETSAKMWILITDIVSYVYWTVHHLDSWAKGDQLDVTCFIISLYNVQHVSEFNTSILRSLRLMCWVILWVTSNQINVTHEITQHISRKLLRMYILTSETCWALYKEIIKQVTSSWSLFTQLSDITFIKTLFN